MPPKKAAPTPRKSGSGSTSGANTKKPSIAKPKGSPASKSTVVSKKKSTSPKKSTAKVKDQADTKGKVATKEDAAATKIQSHFRVMLAKKEVGRRKIEKEQYDKEMERLEREVRSSIIKIRTRPVIATFLVKRTPTGSIEHLYPGGTIGNYLKFT